MLQMCQELAFAVPFREPYGRSRCEVPDVNPPGTAPREVFMGSLVKKRRKKMSKHKYRKRIKANRHKRKR